MGTLPKRSERRQGRPWRRAAGVVFAGLAIAIPCLAGPLAADATTGPTPLAHAPRFNVTEAQAAPYLGSFKLVQPLDRQLISGAYGAGHNERGFVEGSIEIYHYEAAGRETVLLGRTYEYHAVGDRMDIDIISPANQTILARLRLHHARSGRLSGNLTSLLPPGPPQTITLAPTHRASGSTPASDRQAREAPDDAGTVQSGSPTASTTAPEIAKAIRGFFTF